MTELWNDFWWAIILVVLLAAGGGVTWSRKRDAGEEAQDD